MPSPRRYLLILAGLFAIMLAAVWAYTVNGRMQFLDTDYPQWRAKLDMLDRCETGDVAILGDSRAAAGYVPRLLGTGVRNLTLTGATPVETFYEARRIVTCPHPPRTVVLSFSPHQYETIQWLWLHAVSYGLLGFDDLQEIAAAERPLGRSDLYGGAFGSEPPPAMKNWMYAHHFPPFDFASLLAIARHRRWATNERIYNETRASNGQHVIGVPARCATGLASETKQANFVPHPLVTLYLREMLSLFDRKGIHVIFGATPISAESARALRPAYLAGYQAYLRREARPFSTTTVADDLLPTRPDCDFGDAHHLTQAGADAFSRSYKPVLTRLIEARQSR